MSESGTIVDKDNLAEVFASPIGLKPVVRIDGETLYGSERLNNSYMKALEKCGRTRAAASKLHALVLKRKIIPCFKTKGFKGFLAWKIFAPVHQQAELGFYDPTKTKRIYIIISNNTNIFAFASNDFLGKLTIHELMHMLADQKTSLFLNMFKKELLAYYKELFKMIFSMKDIDSGRMERVLKHIFMDIERKSASMTMGTLNRYSKVLEKEFSGITTMSQSEFQKTLNDFITIIKIYLVSVERFFKSRDQFRHIIAPMYLAYKRGLSLTNYTTVCIQELIFPSEVIAIASEDMRYGKKALAGATKL